MILKMLVVVLGAGWPLVFLVLGAGWPLVSLVCSTWYVLVLQLLFRMVLDMLVSRWMMLIPMLVLQESYGRCNTYRTIAVMHYEIMTIRFNHKMYSLASCKMFYPNPTCSQCTSSLWSTVIQRIVQIHIISLRVSFAGLTPVWSKENLRYTNQNLPARKH